MQARYSRWGLAAIAALGCVVSLLAYFTVASGVDHTAGALLVVISTAILALAGAILAAVRSAPAGLRGFLIGGSLLDIAGTATAAWFLHAWVLLALMVLAVIAWVMVLTAPKPRHAAA